MLISSNYGVTINPLRWLMMTSTIFFLPIRSAFIYHLCYEYDLIVSMLELTRRMYMLCIFLHTSVLLSQKVSSCGDILSAPSTVISNYNMFHRNIPNANTLMMCKQVLSACLWFVLIIRFSVLHLNVLLSTLELDLYLAFTIQNPVMSCINFDLLRTKRSKSPRRQLAKSPNPRVYTRQFMFNGHYPWIFQNKMCKW